MRSVLLIAHTSREQITSLATRTAGRLLAEGFQVRMLPGEAAAIAADVTVEPVERAAAGAELVLVFGGDGTFLRAAELARPAGVPMLGVNLGHVGFLAEAEPHALSDTVDAVVNHSYAVEERVTVDAEVVVDDAVQARAWALNEASLERTNRERMLEVGVAVDGRPLLRFGCDGVLCATPTGSTAYAFSAGGPVVWPEVEAMLVVPISAHALYSRPMVVSPHSVVAFEVLTDTPGAVLWCDGRRSVPVPSGARVRLRRGEFPVRIVRLGRWSFADRLVSKFQLPVRSFRDAAPPPDDLVAE
jgi:NAD+ kinase